MELTSPPPAQVTSSPRFSILSAAPPIPSAVSLPGLCELSRIHRHRPHCHPDRSAAPFAAPPTLSSRPECRAFCGTEWRDRGSTAARHATKCENALSVFLSTFNFQLFNLFSASSVLSVSSVVNPSFLRFSLSPARAHHKLSYSPCSLSPLCDANSLPPCASLSLSSSPRSDG